MHRAPPVHPAGARHQPRSSRGSGSTAQLVLIALAAATAIFFTTSLLVMDHSPINGKGFGPSQFVARMGRTAALIGVVGSERRSSSSSSSGGVEEEGEGEMGDGPRQGAGGADVVKTWRATNKKQQRKEEEEEEEDTWDDELLSEEEEEEEGDAKPIAAAAMAPSSGQGPAAEEEGAALEEEEGEDDEALLLAKEVEALEAELLLKEEQLEEKEQQEQQEQQEEQQQQREGGDKHPPSPPETASAGDNGGGDEKQEATTTTTAVTTTVVKQQSPKATKEVPVPPEGRTCQAFLEEEDTFKWERDFEAKPIRVHRNRGAEGDGKCDVPCFIGQGNDYLGYDATYDQQFEHAARIKWTMESYTNYPDTEVGRAHQLGFDVVMTPRLDAEVSCVYFGWAKWEDVFFNPMRLPPVPAAQKENIAAAYISNCGARSFRLKALEVLEAANITVHSHGRCKNNMKNMRKDDLLPRIKFSLAFENSIETDYVTEKYLQALNFGAVPVVIGAPNIQDFAPSDNSIIHIPNEEALPAVAARMKYLMANDTAYDEMLRWKIDGPSDQFLALIDIGTVHPECRLCQYLADRHRQGEMNKRSAHAAARPCACHDPSSKTTTHHLKIRERHTFEHRSLFLAEPLTVERLHAAIYDLYGADHKPVWARARPSYRKKLENGSWDREHVQLKIHRVYPSYITQREALYGRSPDVFTVQGDGAMDKGLAGWVAKNPCGLLDVTFV